LFLLHLLLDYFFFLCAPGARIHALVQRIVSLEFRVKPALFLMKKKKEKKISKK
jgi:hypothetical protein